MIIAHQLWTELSCDCVQGSSVSGAGASVYASDRVMSQYPLYKSTRVIVWEYVQDQHWQLLADSCGASHVFV